MNTSHPTSTLRAIVASKKYMLIQILFLVSLFASCQNKDTTYELKEGDIVFQDMDSRQGKAIKLATHSEYTHVGIVLKKGDAFYVLEGVQPVRYTKFEDWIKQGKNGHFVIKRLRENQLTGDMIAQMKEVGENMLNKGYDIYFNWSDKEIYCSELVWKLYKRGANIEICPTRKLKSFDLESPLVKMIMKERYGDQIPYDEDVVAPSDLFDAPLLELVYEN